MILPTKRIPEDRSLLYVGAQILGLLDEPKTVSRLWDELQGVRARDRAFSPLTYDWFVLSVDLLYTVAAIDLQRGRLVRRS